MKILITGATGYVGKQLSLELLRRGHDLVVLTRSLKNINKKFPLPAQIFEWPDPVGSRPPQEAFAGVDAIVNLAGESINQRWTDSAKRSIYDSRVSLTKNLVEGLKNSPCGVKKMVSTSATGFYGDQKDKLIDENSAAGDGFLSDVCKDWERVATKFATQPDRKLIILRVGAVVGRLAPFMTALKPLVRSRALGRIGVGNQWLAWVYIDDLVAMYADAVESENIEGIFNCISPEPIKNKVWSKALTEKAGVAMGPPVPAFVIKALYGEMSQLILGSQNLKPSLWANSDFRYTANTFKEAVELCYPRGYFENYFEAWQWVNKPKSELFPFFSEAKNLQLLTPKFLGFKVLKQSTPRIQQGTLIDYKIKLKGVPMSWQTLIKYWDPPNSFVDTQLRGPYKTWHHQHIFEDLNGGSLMIDKVHFELPLGALGQAVAGRFVEKDVQTIFNFRFDAVAKLYEDL